MQSHSEIIQSTQSKCSKIKITCTCNLFIQRFPALHLNVFVPNVFNKRNLRYNIKTFECLAFNHAKDSQVNNLCPDRNIDCFKNAKKFLKMVPRCHGNRKKIPEKGQKMPSRRSKYLKL